MIVLDTHVWVWWVSGAGTLSVKARDAIREHAARSAVNVSSISVWEVAQLVARGRLELTMDVADWVARSEALPFLRFVPVDNATALRSTRLPGRLHADPADRIIVSTALGLGARLVTRDRRLQRYAEVETIW